MVQERGSDFQKIDYFSDHDRPYGISYGQWTVRWWQWAKSAPKEINPVIDETGKYAHINQQGPVWYLAGTFGENKIPHRTCKIPADIAVLFPVINYEMNPLEKPELAKQADLISHVIQDIDDIIIRYAIVDEMRIPVYRIKSDPLVFSLTINSENNNRVFGETTYAVADGYWVFLKPLPKGKHHIYFHGSCAGGLRNAAADYSILVN
jgi:hypothetical protein